MAAKYTPDEIKQLQAFADANPGTARASKAIQKIREAQTNEAPPPQRPETQVNPGSRPAWSGGAGMDMRQLAGMGLRLGLPVAAGLATGGAGFVPAMLAAGAAGAAGGAADDYLNDRPITPTSVAWDAGTNMLPLAAIRGAGAGLGTAARSAAAHAGDGEIGALRSLLTRAAGRSGGITPAEKIVMLGKTGGLRTAASEDIGAIGKAAAGGGDFASATPGQINKLGARAGIADEMAPLVKQNPNAGLTDSQIQEMKNLSPNTESTPEAAAALQAKYEATAKAGTKAKGLRGGVPPTPPGVDTTPEGIAAAKASAKSLQAHAGEADLAARADKNLPELQRQGTEVEAKSFEASKNLKQAVDATVPSVDQKIPWLDKSGRSPQDVFTDVKSNYPTADNRTLRDAANNAQEAFRGEGVIQDAQRQALVDKARATGLLGKVPSMEDVAADAARVEQIGGWAGPASAANRAEGAAAAMGASADPAADAMASNAFGRASKISGDLRALSARGDALGGVDPALADSYRARSQGLQNWLASGTRPAPVALDIAHPVSSVAKRVGQAFTPKPDMNLMGEAELAYRGLPPVNPAMGAKLMTPNNPYVSAAIGGGLISGQDKYKALQDWLSQAQNQ